MCGQTEGQSFFLLPLLLLLLLLLILLLLLLSYYSYCFYCYNTSFSSDITVAVFYSSHRYAVRAHTNYITGVKNHTLTNTTNDKEAAPHHQHQRRTIQSTYRRGKKRYQKMQIVSCITLSLLRFFSFLFFLSFFPSRRNNDRLPHLIRGQAGQQNTSHARHNALRGEHSYR